MSTTPEAAGAEQAQAHSFDPVVVHRVKRAEIVRAVLTGEPVTALCGEVWEMQAEEALYDGPGVACPLCELVLEEKRATRR